MKTLALLLLAVTFAASADDLVATAKAAKERKSKSTTKVITNADVKKSKAKVGETKATVPVETVPRKSLVDEYEKSYHERIAREEKVAATTKKIADLERQLAAIEQSYYEENDLDRRDTDIVKRFNETSAKLEEARKELAGLTPSPAQ